MKNNAHNKISRKKLAIIITAITSVALIVFLAVMLKCKDIQQVYIQTVSDGSDAAFKLEAQWMNEYAKEGKRLLNSICSPGFSKGGIDIFETLKRLLFGKW